MSGRLATDKPSASAPARKLSMQGPAFILQSVSPFRTTSSWECRYSSPPLVTGHRKHRPIVFTDLELHTLQNWLGYSTATGDRRAHTGDTTSAAAFLVHLWMRKTQRPFIALFHPGTLSGLMRSVVESRTSPQVPSRSSLSECRELLCSIRRWRSG